MGLINKRISSLCSRIQDGFVVHHPGASFLLILHTDKNVENLCFHDFSWFSETRGMPLELFCKNVHARLYIENMGTILPRVTWCVTNFGYLTTLAFQCDFKCKTCLAKYDVGNIMCEESSYTMTWYEEETDLKRAWHFYWQTNLPL